MATRSLKPGSYVGTAKKLNIARPSFARTSSSSSTTSTILDESSIATLRSLSPSVSAPGKLQERPSNSNSNSSTAQCQIPSKWRRECLSSGKGALLPYQPANRQTPPAWKYVGGPWLTVNFPADAAAAEHQLIEEAQARRGSRPIAIGMPSVRTAVKVYTPLSARGDLQGGYFPNHEEYQRSYKSHPFHEGTVKQSTSTEISPTMSAESSTFSTPGADLTTKGQLSSTTNQFYASMLVPDVLSIPKGKYHPSKYQVPIISGSQSGSSDSKLLSVPSGATNKARPKHERNISAVKRKLVQYEREMIEQGRVASTSSRVITAEPISPRLLPLGSPGPITTPFELEESSATGYMAASHTRDSASASDAGSERLEEVDRQNDWEIKERVSGTKSEKRPGTMVTTS